MRKENQLLILNRLHELRKGVPAKYVLDNGNIRNTTTGLIVHGSIEQEIHREILILGNNTAREHHKC